MPKRQTAQEKKDAAYNRVMGLTDPPNKPDASGQLPGQTAMFDDGAAVDSVPSQMPGRERAMGAEAPPLDPIPNTCPSCMRALSVEHGWAYSKSPDAPTIQCPKCGARYSVTPEEHERYRAAVRAIYSKVTAPLPIKPKRQRRTRGGD